MLSIEDIKDLLGIPLLGVVNESQTVLNASNSGTPVILDAGSDAGLEYKYVVKRFLGKAPPFKETIKKKKQGFLKRLFKSEEALV